MQKGGGGFKSKIWFPKIWKIKNKSNSILDEKRGKGFKSKIWFPKMCEKNENKS